jgi:hypothetical protein
MRLLLKRTKNNVKEQIYQFNVNFGLLVSKDQNKLDDDFDLDFLTLHLIKFNENTEEGFEKISEAATLFAEDELEGRLKRLDTLVNTMRLREAIRDFTKFDMFSDIDFNDSEKRVSYVPKWKQKKEIKNKK